MNNALQAIRTQGRKVRQMQNNVAFLLQNSPDDKALFTAVYYEAFGLVQTVEDYASRYARIYELWQEIDPIRTAAHKLYKNIENILNN